MKKRILLPVFVVVALFLTGCNGSAWVTDRRPETPEERKAVMEHETKILSQIPHTLSGHDQDWDDVVAVAHRAAVQTQCKERLYEVRTGVFVPRNDWTGRMREYIEESKP